MEFEKKQKGLGKNLNLNRFGKRNQSIEQEKQCQLCIREIELMEKEKLKENARKEFLYDS